MNHGSDYLCILRWFVRVFTWSGKPVRIARNSMLQVKPILLLLFIFYNLPLGPFRSGICSFSNVAVLRILASELNTPFVP